MAGIFEVDDAKCVSCGACVRDCAFHALKMEQRFDPRHGLGGAGASDPAADATKLPEYLKDRVPGVGW